MSIEVIGQDESKYKQVSCKNCGAILRYLQVDVQQGKLTDYTGDSEVYSYIICPRCKCRVIVKS